MIYVISNEDELQLSGFREKFSCKAVFEPCIKLIKQITKLHIINTDSEKFVQKWSKTVKIRKFFRKAKISG